MTTYTDFFASRFFHLVSVRLSAQMRPDLAAIPSGAFCLAMTLDVLSEKAY